MPHQSQPNMPEPPSTDFPSLAAAATTKPKKKNKAQTLSLAEFNTYSAADTKPTTTNEHKRLTQDELLMLPTGPRERTADELEKNRLGGGFRNYGGDRDRARVSDNRRDNSNRERVDLGPSRADEVDDWSKTKKFNSFGSGPGDRSERREKGGFFNSSRADEVDNWAANKSFVEAPRRERRMGFDSYSNGSGPDSDNWLKKKEERAGAGAAAGAGAGEDTWGRKESNGPNGRPKLNLQPRTLPVVRSENVTPSPTEGKAKGANPFGEARPREEVLKEKGKDWKEIDEKLEAVKIKEVSSNGEKGEGFGRRRGFGMSGEEKTVKSWRKPESGDPVPSPTGSRFDSKTFDL